MHAHGTGVAAPPAGASEVASQLASRTAPGATRSPPPPATTGAAPLVTSSVADAAAAQHVYRVLDAYDFKFSGPGLTVGSEAVPLTPQGHRVLFAPNTQAAAAPAGAAGSQHAAATNADAAGGVAGAPHITHTQSGTHALQLQPLPHQQQQQQPAGAPASAAQSQAAGLRYRGGGASSNSAAPHALQAQAGAAAATAPPQRRHAQHADTGIVAAAEGWWDAAKARAAGLWQWLLRELAFAAVMLMQWLLWLVVAPAKALLGPGYRYNRQLKQKSLSHLAQPFDLAQLQQLLGALPSWLSGIGGATEDLEWLNILLAEIWPILDPVVCELVRSTVEPLLDDMKPPFIAAMGFQKLTLGGARVLSLWRELPVVLDGIRLAGSNDAAGRSGDASIEAAADNAQRAQAEATSDDWLEIEVDFHWVGEPNISFFVELALAGPYTRLVPKVSNLNSQGTLRLGLTRLVPELPGFGALLVSFARNPQIKFTLDFGPAMGGKVTAKPVASFLDPFLRDTLASLLVWPNRFVVPLLPRAVTGNLDDLALHSVGVLEVEVLAAHGLPKKGGFLSTVDPQVELWTQPQHRVTSAVKRNRRNANWKGQRLEVLVQEPDSQLLRLVVQDIDLLNLKELFKVNIIRGASNMLRSANRIGHAALPLREVCAAPNKRHELELRLAGSEWAYELGVSGSGEDDGGRLSIAVTYAPFRDLDARSTAPINCRGALFVDVRQCQELPSDDWRGGSSDPYVLLKVAGQKSQTVVIPHSLSPVYNAHFEFFNVCMPDVLEVQVWDRDFLKPDDLLGRLELPVTAVMTWTQGGVRGVRDGWWRLWPKGQTKSWEGPGAGRIELRVQFRPYTT